MKKIVLGSGVPEFEEAGKTGGLVLYLMKSLHNSARYVVLNSRFCLLSALVALRKVGVFAGALIKNREFWPMSIVGNAINNHTGDQAVCDVAAVQRHLEDTI